VHSLDSELKNGQRAGSGIGAQRNLFGRLSINGFDFTEAIGTQRAARLSRGQRHDESGEALKMNIVICFRHLRCICRKSRRGMDYSWHVQHLLREFGCGRFADTTKASQPYKLQT
jgi:hypothetical protein